MMRERGRERESNGQKLTTARSRSTESRSTESSLGKLLYMQFPLMRTHYKGHFWRLVKFLGKIRDRLVLVNKFTVAVEIFTMKLPYNEATFWDMTIQNCGKFLGQTSLKSTPSLLSKAYKVHR